MEKSLILAGNYGSGKTELSLNLALEFAKKGRTVLADMDIVNPYFRSAEHKELLQKNGVHLIAPNFANTTVDVPSISAEVYSAFLYDYAIFDGGGDPVGASVFGSIIHRFDPAKTDFLYVINARRPLQGTPDDIIEMMQQISAKVRMPVTGLVNNTNLSFETTLEDLLFGKEITEEVSKRTGIPVLLTSGTKEIIEQLKSSGFDGPTFSLIPYTRPEWIDII